MNFFFALNVFAVVKNFGCTVQRKRLSKAQAIKNENASPVSQIAPLVYVMYSNTKKLCKQKSNLS